QRQSTGVTTRPTNPNVNDTPIAEDESPEATVDPVEVEYARISQQIPRTDEAKQEALALIEEAYFHLGDIYYLKLQERENAIETYRTLLTRFPETEYEPEVLYALYLMLKDFDEDTSEHYATLLKTKYPNSTFARILVNPNYLQESSQAAEKQKDIYNDAYRLFEMKDYK